MYEPLVSALSALLLMPLPPWMPPARTRENWADPELSPPMDEDRSLELSPRRAARV